MKEKRSFWSRAGSALGKASDVAYRGMVKVGDAYEPSFKKKPSTASPATRKAPAKRKARAKRKAMPCPRSKMMGKGKEKSYKIVGKRRADNYSATLRRSGVSFTRRKTGPQSWMFTMHKRK